MSPDSRLGFHLLRLAGALGGAALTAKQPGLLLLPQAIALALDVDGGRVVEQPIQDRRPRIWSLKTSPQSTKLLLLVTMRLARS